MALVEPLNLEYWLVNTLAGSPVIFIGIMTILISSLAAKFRMNTFNFGMILALFAVLMAPLANWFLFIVILISGFMIYFTLGRLFRT